MEYRYSPRANYEDLASGRVLYHVKNIANFPVRLQAEIYCRAKQYLPKKTGLTIYDPCCGGGGSLATLGFLFNEEIDSLIGSDIDPEMVSCAEKNLSLLSKEGLAGRKKELEQFYRDYQKESHLGAIDSAARLEKLLVHAIETKVLTADCTKPLPDIKPDLVITDVPYGNLAEWNDTDASSLEVMLARIYEIAQAHTILAVCMDKRQKIRSEKWQRLERENIGKRRFEILRKL